MSETLRRAVSAGRTGHAYLFCGPRGVGKTTLARVLAMALNCPDRTEEGEPCGVCESCARIWGGHTALDVVEIDAASNRGVDDARDLRERAMYAPSAEGRTKVYIIDEAHMLTREAWNALLKILEEPPPRVVFVFATTEPQKINQFAAPILSRCQRFDFRRISVADIVSRLRAVLDQEGSAAADEALRIIARKADGGLRDALSILDQVISLTGGEVDAPSVRRVLGLVEEDRYLELLDILRDQRHGDVFVLVEGLIDEGYDLVEFYHGLLDTLRALLRLRLSSDAPLELPEGVLAQLLERAPAFEPGDLVRMLAAAAELENQGSLRRSPNPRLPIEMLLLRMSFLDRTVDIEELIRALGGAPPRASGTPHREGAAPPGVTGSPRGGGEPGRPRHRGEPAASVPARTDARDARVDGRASGSVAAAVSPAEIEPSASAAEGWARWLEAGSTVPAGLGAFLRSAAVAEGADGSIEISMPGGPAVERLGRAAVIDQMRSGLTPYLGRAPELVIRTGAEPRIGAGRPTEEAVREDTLRALYRQEPRLRRAVEELDLELMD